MNFGRRLVCVALATLIAVACGGSGDDRRAPAANTVLQFQGATEELRLGTLRVDQRIYRDVAFRLAQDGTWQLLPPGAPGSLEAGAVADAVLQANPGTELGANWRPTLATITVSRLHIGSRVYRNVPLQLAGDRWFWGSALQAGDDTRDLEEAKALTLADFRANPALAATAGHHVVLHSAADRRVQDVPMRLEAGRFRFCMDRQQDGADTIALLDSGGAALVTLRAGDACVETRLAAGAYTLRHEYGGNGAARTVFVRPAGDGAVAGGRLQALAAAAAAPEYWAIAAPAPGGFLSFNAVYPPQQACKGFIDAAAKLSSFTRSGDPASYPLLHAKNFFRIYRAADGTPTDFAGPLWCEQARYGVSFWNDMEEGAGPLLLSPSGYYLRNAMSTVPIKAFSQRSFRLGYVYYCGVYPDDCWAEADFGFGDGTTMAALHEADIWQMTRDWYPFNGLSASNPDTFQVAFRYFPDGLPPAMQDAYGTWLLGQGEVAFFRDAGCSGAALVARHQGTLAPQPATAGLGAFSGSLQLGPNAVLTATRNGAARRIVQSGCASGAGAVDLARDSIAIEVTTQIDIHTNSCEECNLAGIDLSSRVADLQGVKLAGANLTDAKFANSDLSRADLRGAVLQGANLANANLESANLCQSFLNGQTFRSGISGPAATLAGAHLKNANLAGAHADGSTWTAASFYSSSMGACEPPGCDAPVLPTCASARNASFNNADFGGAYLANVDMSHAVATGASFSNAILFGARLLGVNLGASASSGRPSSFNGALLHGADFGTATLTGATFKSATSELGGSGCTQVLLGAATIGFPGFTVPSTARPPSCVTPPQVPPSTCVAAIHGTGLPPPRTDATNICPDGGNGPCADASWQGPPVQSTSSCTGPAPLCGDPFTGRQNTCWN